MQSKSFYDNIPLPDYEQIINCMHCGMCLPTCPTYELTGLEKDSPRGRIRMIKAVAEGEMEITDNFIASMNFCLDCQACVTACPAGVKYGQLVEAARHHIEARNQAEGKVPLIKKLMLQWVFAENKRLKLIGFFMELYRKAGLEFLVQKLGLLKLISKKMHELSFMMPPFRRSARFENGTHPNTGEKNIKVGIVTGCVQDVFFRDVNTDTEAVLKYNGYDVFVPQDQQCCGSVHGHNGDLETAKKLAKLMIDSFDTARVDYIVLNSAGCGSYMKEYHHLLQDDMEYNEKARRFSEKVKDISEILVMHGWEPAPEELVKKVTYHDPCHLVHGQGISQQPRKLLQSIRGLELIDLAESTWCCGSAGIYNITHYDDSMKLLERKMDNIEKTGAQIVVTGNPGCMIQLIYGARKFNKSVQVLHPVTLLRESYRI